MSNIKFVFDGNTYSFARPSAGSVYDTLPPAVYGVQVTDKGEIKIKHLYDQFILPEKIVHCSKSRYLNAIGTTYSHRKERGLNTGVLLTGMKGTGKSLMAKRLCNRMIENGYPVLRIDSAIPANVVEAILMVTGPAGVLMDEFAKTYCGKNRGIDKDYQNQLLGLFSSSEFSGALFILTENQADAVSSLFKNRPGRILFHLEFAALTDSEAYRYMLDYGFSQKAARYLTVVLKHVTMDVVASVYELCLPYKAMLDEGVGEREFIEWSKKQYRC